MGYTDLDYYIEARLVLKLDAMIKRCTQTTPKMDVAMIMEGNEGEGKTNGALCCAYYVRYKTGRDIHLFFRLRALIEYAKKTESKVIIWDEPSLDSLSTDSLNKINKDLIRLLMTARKKRHFIIFNFTKFFKFSEYIVVDRCVALIHMYMKRQQEIGHYVYIRKRNLEALYNGYKFGKKRMYKTLKNFYGSFPEVMEVEGGSWFKHMDVTVHGANKTITSASLEDYNREKDYAIESIGEEEEKSDKPTLELKAFKYKISQLKPPILNKEILAKQLGTDARTMRTWAYTSQTGSKELESLEKGVFEGEEETI